MSAAQVSGFTPWHLYKKPAFSYGGAGDLILVVDPHGSSQPSGSPVSGKLAFSSYLLGNLCSAQTYIHASKNTYLNKTKETDLNKQKLDQKDGCGLPPNLPP